TADVVVMITPAIASGCRTSSEPLITAVRYFRLCMYATSASTSAAGRLPYFAGIGGFLVDLAFAAASTGCLIHCLMSSPDNFVPTLSSGFALLPLPAIWWHTEHFCAVYTCWPFCTAAASCAAAGSDTAIPARVSATPATILPVVSISMEPPQT